MKKLGLISILVAGSMFAASFDKNSNDELYKMIEGADSKTLIEISFEIHKRAGKLNSEAREIKRGFHDKMHKKISSMKDEDRTKFMQDYRGLMRDKIDSLSIKEAKEMGFFSSADKMGFNGGCQSKGMLKGYHGKDQKDMGGIDKRQGKRDGQCGGAMKGGCEHMMRGATHPCMQGSN